MVGAESWGMVYAGPGHRMHAEFKHDWKVNANGRKMTSEYTFYWKLPNCSRTLLLLTGLEMGKGHWCFFFSVFVGLINCLFLSLLKSSKLPFLVVLMNPLHLLLHVKKPGAFVYFLQSCLCLKFSVNGEALTISLKIADFYIIRRLPRQQLAL